MLNLSDAPSGVVWPAKGHEPVCQVRSRLLSRAEGCGVKSGAAGCRDAYEGVGVSTRRTMHAHICALLLVLGHMAPSIREGGGGVVRMRKDEGGFSPCIGVAFPHNLYRNVSIVYRSRIECVSAVVSIKQMRVRYTSIHARYEIAALVGGEHCIELLIQSQFRCFLYR